MNYKPFDISERFSKPIIGRFSFSESGSNYDIFINNKTPVMVKEGKKTIPYPLTKTTLIEIQLLNGDKYRGKIKYHNARIDENILSFDGINVSDSAPFSEAHIEVTPQNSDIIIHVEQIYSIICIPTQNVLGSGAMIANPIYHLPETGSETGSGSVPYEAYFDMAPGSETGSETGSGYLYTEAHN